MTRDNIEDCAYLSCFIREILRWDSPLQRPFNLHAYEDVQLSNLTIKKGTEISYNIHAIHKNPKEWISPHEFIPDRFDPESPYFKQPSRKP